MPQALEGLGFQEVPLASTGSSEIKAEKQINMHAYSEVHPTMLLPGKQAYDGSVSLAVKVWIKKIHTLVARMRWKEKPG